MPPTDHYQVLKPDGTQSNPFTYKGLMLQLKKGQIKREDMIIHESWDAPRSLDLFLKQLSESHDRPQSALPPVKEKRKTQLPPVRGEESPAEPEEGYAIDEYVRDFDSVSSHYDSPHPVFTSGWSTLFGSIAGMLTAILLFHMYMTYSISDSIVFGKNIPVKMEEYHYLHGMFSGFLYILLGLTVFSFLVWIRRATLNVQELTDDDFPIPVTNMVISYLIPVFNIWAGYSYTRYLLNASINPLGPYGKHRPVIMIWWAAVCFSLYYRFSRNESNITTTEGARDYLTQIIYSDVLSALATILSMIVVYAIASSQRKTFSLAIPKPVY